MAEDFYAIAPRGGRITVGVEAEIDEEGGITIKADHNVLIEIGDGARLLAAAR